MGCCQECCSLVLLDSVNQMLVNIGLGIAARRILIITAQCQVCFTASLTACCLSPTLKLQQMQVGGSTANLGYILRATSTDVSYCTL